MIVKESSHRGGAAGAGVGGGGPGSGGAAAGAGVGSAADLIPHIGEATAEDPLGTYFVSYKQFREELPDDRHKHRCPILYLPLSAPRGGQPHMLSVHQ